MSTHWGESRGDKFTAGSFEESVTGHGYLSVLVHAERVRYDFNCNRVRIDDEVAAV